MKKNASAGKKKSMAFEIFRNTFLVGALVYFVCSAVFIDQLYKYFEQQIFRELETEAELAIQGYRKGGIDFVQGIDIRNRITLIDSGGNVLFDNHADYAEMENHLEREEVSEALKKGKGYSSRYSVTLMKKSLYAAIRMDENTIMRVSCDQHTVGILVFGMSQPLLLLFVIALIISGLIATLLAKQITESINKIDLDNPRDCQVYEELKPFTERIADENYEKSQREEIRHQFTANVSHELKTPLTSISGFAELMKDGSVDNQTMMDFAGDIYNESQRLIVLVNDIIKLSRLDEQSISLEKKRINLKEIAQSVCETLHQAAQKKDVTVNLIGTDGFISGVPQVITEMVYNLCDNAIKYNRQGGRVDIAVSANAADGTVTLSVKDTGIGIPENARERVFERFYCVDKSRSKQVGGTGLGLSIVKHGAKYHNARIYLDSTEGVGSKFTVVFPAE
ncbi:ATP-binding protein [Treponema sp.]|uniref:sensor histidine kinase n=1 Tax=Treponema sp. TaxID=166 RepID=UPI00257D90FD|nr:ATP-binding protein [Treponema sp.]